LLVAAPAIAEDIVVEVQGGPPFKFEQPNITIKPGDTVKWVNKSGVLHTITADEAGALGGTGNLEGDGPSSEHAEAVKGGPRTIAYHCDIHPKMKGTITVQAAAPPKASASKAARKAKKKPRKTYNTGY
jgi:plastocyanin